MRLPAAPSPRVSVVVVTASRPERLLRCLEAIERHAPSAIALEVVLVLNGPAVEVEETVDREVVGARVVATEISLGFAGGLNLGAQHARGQLLHVLHDDTEVRAGWLDRLVDALDSDDRVGAAGSLLLNTDGTVQAAGWILWRDGTTSLPWVEPPEADTLGEVPFAVDYSPSASFLIRRDVWDAMGGADEELHPAYYVDVDLAMSVRRQGRAVVCAPASRVEHAVAQPRRFREFAAARNAGHFVAKWSDDLVHQPVRQAGAQPLAQARAAAERRRATLDPRPHTATNAATVDLDDAVARERALLRDLRFKDAYIRHLENEVKARGSEVGALISALEVIEAGRVRRAHRRVNAALRAIRRVGRG